VRQLWHEDHKVKRYPHMLFYLYQMNSIHIHRHFKKKL
jgi:hypothetical protein